MAFRARKVFGRISGDISKSYFYEWPFGPEKFSGLSRNGPKGPVVQSAIKLIRGNFNCYLYTVKGGFFTRLRFTGKNCNL